MEERHTAEGHNGSRGIVGRVRDRAEAQLSTQKDRATDGLGSVAQAVRGSTQQLRAQQHDTIARYVEQAADQVERFARRLRDKDVGDLFREAQRLARRQPAVLIGSAFALGLIGARFLKSSAPDGEIYESGDPGAYENSAGLRHPAGDMEVG